MHLSDYAVDCTLVVFWEDFEGAESGFKSVHVFFLLFVGEIDECFGDDDAVADEGCCELECWQPAIAHVSAAARQSINVMQTVWRGIFMDVPLRW